MGPAMKEEIDNITSVIIGCALRIHNTIGPGLLETAYEKLLADDLTQAGHTVDRQKLVTLNYDGRRLVDCLRADLIVDGLVVVEVKSRQAMHPVFAQQVLTYLRMLDLRVGLVLNFGTSSLGIKRVVNSF
jgi:GxxExxY protein